MEAEPGGRLGVHLYRARGRPLAFANLLEAVSKGKLGCCFFGRINVSAIVSLMQSNAG